jgi:hypothetical protein
MGAMDPIVTRKIHARCYPAELIAACEWLFITPTELIDWAVRSREVVLILSDGSKAIFPIHGAWRASPPKRTSPIGYTNIR